MPRFSIQIETVSRKKGSSAVRHAAYRAGQRIRDERYNRTRDFTAKSDIVHAEIVAPPDAPVWALDRSRLWNRVEAAERRKDSRLAQEVYVAIPREVDEEKRVEAIREFVQETFVSMGMVADFAVHAPVASDGREDPHAHILLTTRSLGADGFGLKVREWSHPARVLDYRRAWEKHANHALGRSGRVVMVDRRSLREQLREAERSLERAVARRDPGAARHYARKAALLDRTPEISLGRKASHMEKRGRRTARGRKLREIRARNARTERQRIKTRVRGAMREIRRLDRAHRRRAFRRRMELNAVYALPLFARRRVFLWRNLRERERLRARRAEREAALRLEDEREAALYQEAEHGWTSSHERNPNQLEHEKPALTRNPPPLTFPPPKQRVEEPAPSRPVPRPKFGPWNARVRREPAEWEWYGLDPIPEDAEAADTGDRQQERKKRPLELAPQDVRDASRETAGGLAGRLDGTNGRSEAREPSPVDGPERLKVWVDELSHPFPRIFRVDRGEIDFER